MVQEHLKRVTDHRDSNFSKIPGLFWFKYSNIQPGLFALLPELSNYGRSFLHANLLAR